MNPRRWFGDLSITSRTMSRYQWTARSLKLLNGYSPFPLHIDVMLTLRCNLACKICVERKPEFRDFLAPYWEPEMPLEKWKDIIRDMNKSFFKPNLHIQGGEIGMYEGYLELTAFAKQLGFRCTYVTNGTSLARDAAEIVSMGVNVILVSIDGPRQVHDSIRGPGVFDAAVQGIRAINEQKRVQGKKKPQVFVNCAINPYNQHILASYIDTVKEWDVNYITYLHYLFPDSEMDTHNIDVEHLVAEMGRIQTKAAQNNIKVNYYPHLKVDQVAAYYLQPGDQVGQNCLSPWLRMIITPNGKVISCKSFVIGDLNAEGATVRGIWNDERFRAFRKKLARNNLLPGCGRCCRKRYH